MQCSLNINMGSENNTQLTWHLQKLIDKVVCELDKSFSQGIFLDLTKGFDTLNQEYPRIHVCVNPLTSITLISSIETVGHRLRSTPTNGLRFSALGLHWWSPIQVLTGLDVI